MVSFLQHELPNGEPCSSIEVRSKNGELQISERSKTHLSNYSKVISLVNKIMKTPLKSFCSMYSRLFTHIVLFASIDMLMFRIFRVCHNSLF